MTTKLNKHPPINNMTQKYMFKQNIGHGAFGEVYMAIRLFDGKLVAMKVENRKIDIPRLHTEYNFYKKMISRNLRRVIPHVFEFIQTPEYNIMVMEVLGDNLEDIFNKHDKKFSVSTVLYLGYHIVNILEKIHQTNFIHRDIKPSNFLVGHNDKKRLYVTDFGLSKEYIKNNQHIPISFEHSIIGTARYSSLNMHIGVEPSRRDDLEALGYMLIYFLRGNLPWQGIKEKTRSDIFETIGKIKLSTNIKNLCGDFPICFSEYINYCRHLEFNETPNYQFMKSLFLSEIKKNNLVCSYEWLKD